VIVEVAISKLKNKSKLKKWWRKNIIAESDKRKK
jgi:hypothetical protein